MTGERQIEAFLLKAQSLGERLREIQGVFETDPEQARKMFRQIENEVKEGKGVFGNPQETDFHLSSIADMEREVGLLEQALETIQSIISDKFLKIRGFLQLFDLYIEQGNLAEAATVLHFAKNEVPDDKNPVLFELGFPTRGDLDITKKEIEKREQILKDK